LIVWQYVQCNSVICFLRTNNGQSAKGVNGLVQVFQRKEFITVLKYIMTGPNKEDIYPLKKMNFVFLKEYHKKSNIVVGDYVLRF
jgi:hypothetical protein